MTTETTNKIATYATAAVLVPIACGLAVKQFLNSDQTKATLAKTKKALHKKAKEVYKSAGVKFNLK